LLSNKIIFINYVKSYVYITNSLTKGLKRELVYNLLKKMSLKPSNTECNDSNPTLVNKDPKI
jgi:hypothetical protein